VTKKLWKRLQINETDQSYLILVFAVVGDALYRKIKVEEEEGGGISYWLLMLVFALEVMSRIAEVRAPLVAPLGPGSSSEVSSSRQPDSRMISRSSPAAPVCFDTSYSCTHSTPH